VALDVFKLSEVDVISRYQCPSVSLCIKLLTRGVTKYCSACSAAPAPRNGVAASVKQSIALLRPSEELLRRVNYCIAIQSIGLIGSLAKKSCDTGGIRNEVMCNCEQTALNKARLFAPVEYYFATKTFPQLRILKPYYENSAYVNRKFLNVKYCKRSRIYKKLRVKHCTYANDAMYFFEDYTLWSAVTAVVRLLWRRSCFR